MLLFIDDQPAPSWPFLDELLKTGLPVTAVGHVKDAWDFLQANPDVRVIVLDVMMPPGTFFTLEETGHGLLTGMMFYRRVRALYSSLPIFVLTANGNPAIAATMQGDPCAELSAKTEVWADDFAAKVADTYRKLQKDAG